jgi:hypothetical protein
LLLLLLLLLLIVAINYCFIQYSSPSTYLMRSIGNDNSLQQQVNHGDGGGSWCSFLSSGVQNHLLL